MAGIGARRVEPCRRVHRDAGQLRHANGGAQPEVGFDDDAIELVPRPFPVLGHRCQQGLEQRCAPQLIPVAAVDGAVGRVVVVRVVAGPSIVQLARGAVGEAGIPVEHNGGLELAARLVALAMAGGQIVAEALADGAPVTLFPEIRHYVVLHAVAELVPDDHGILGIGDAAATQLQPALERIVEGVVLIACVRVDVEGAGDEVGEAEGLEVALGEIQVVVGVDVGKARVVPGQAKGLRVVRLVGGGGGLDGIHHPGMGAAQHIVRALQADRQGDLVLIGGIRQHQGLVPDQAGVLQLGAGIGIEHPRQDALIPRLRGTQRLGARLIPPAAKFAIAVATGKQLDSAGLGIARLVLAHPLAQGRHQGVAVTPVPGFDRPQRVYQAAVGAQLVQQGIQAGAGITAGRGALQGTQIVIEAPGSAGAVYADGGLGGGHRQAVDQHAEAMVMAEQAGPVVVGCKRHAKALLQPGLGCGGQGWLIDKLQFGRQQGLGEQGCRQPEGQGGGFHG